MQRIYYAIIGSILISTVLMAGACLSTDSAERQPFAIVWNYDTSGYLETCGCSAHQLGGIARRATKIADLRGIQPLLAIEGAHFVGDIGEFQLFKAEAIIHSLNQMGYGAMMLGIREAQHGSAGLNKLRQTAQFPCFSANLEAGGTAWPVDTVVSPVGGVRVGITGVSQPEAAGDLLPEDVNFREPRAALDLALHALDGRCDLKVVCLEGDRSWIKAISREFDQQVDLFLAGDRQELTADLEFTADPPLMNNWRYGKYLGYIAVDPLPDNGFSFAGSTIPLEDTILDDSGIIGLLEDKYRSQLKDRFFSQMKVDLEQLYLPPMTCEPCHTEAYENYNESRHARAMNTLVDLGQTYNPDCMTCHVVYDPDQDELVTMNCVVCHTNITEQHLWDAVEDNVTIPEQPVATYTYEFCIQCHDELNDPTYEDYWPQYMYELYHGGDLSEARQAAIDMGIADRIPELNEEQNPAE